MDPWEMYLEMKRLRSDAGLREELGELVMSPDSAKIGPLNKEVARIGVYLPPKLQNENRIKSAGRASITFIVGDYGDGKSTLLKALEALYRKELNAKYASILELETVDKEHRRLIDEVDEAVGINESGEYVLHPKAANLLNEIVHRFIFGRRGRSNVPNPTFASTLTGVIALQLLRSDLRRRTKTLEDLTRPEIRREAFDFIAMRDALYYALDARLDFEEVSEIVQTLRSEASIIDPKLRVPGMLNKLYNDFFEILFSEKDPIKEFAYIGRKYNADFESAAVEVLERSARMLAEGLSNVFIEVIPKGGTGEPDAEIMFEGFDQRLVLAFEAKLTRNGFVKEPAYASRYPGVLYFIASAEKPNVEGFRIPYTLGYVIAKDRVLINDYFAKYLDMRLRLLKAFRRYSGEAGKSLQKNILEIAYKVYAYIISRRKADGSVKAFRLKDKNIIELCEGFDPQLVIQTINSYCGEVIRPGSRGRYNVVTQNPEECLYTLQEALKGGK